MNARGRLVRLDAVLNEILSAHALPPIVEKTLAEALVLTALLGATLKNAEGQLTLQAQTENGAIGLLVCDYKDGGCAAMRSSTQSNSPSYHRTPIYSVCSARAILAITFDRKHDGVEGSGRYQGIVPLEGESLCEAMSSYFAQSEQLPTLIRAAVEPCRWTLHCWRIAAAASGRWRRRAGAAACARWIIPNGSMSRSSPAP